MAERLPKKWFDGQRLRDDTMAAEGDNPSVSDVVLADETDPTLDAEAGDTFSSLQKKGKK